MSDSAGNIADFVGKRVLLTVSKERWSHTSVDEYKILEVSPSGIWVKLQSIFGNKFWKPVSDISLVEVLKQFDPYPQEEK